MATKVANSIDDTVQCDYTKMKLQTLVFIIGDGQILLGKKKVGFGEGKWNGYGGKLEGIESLKHCIKRELQEESNLEVEEKDLMHLGFIQIKEDNTIDRRVHIYSCSRANANGILKETKEMEPQWFDWTDIPYVHMWDDANFWIPLVLKQVRFEATFTRREDVLEFVEINLKPK